LYAAVAVAIAACACAVIMGWTAQDHSVLLRTNGKGEELSPDFRGIPVAPEGSASYVRSKVSNLWLHRQFWAPEGGMEKARAVVVFAHGYAEYSGRFYDIPEALTRADIAVAMQDFEGHGRSEGDTAYVPKFSRLLDDYAQLVRDTKEAHPGLPIVCAGQSMGSLVVGLVAEADASREEPLCDGVVLFGFAGQGAMERVVRKTPIVKFFVDILSAVLPRLPLSHLNTLDELSTDEAQYTSWASDRYCTTQRLLTRTGTQMLNSQLAVCDNAANITAPLLILHGSDDSIGLPGGARDIFEHVSTPADKKKLVMYEGSHHCVLMEPKYEKTALKEFEEFVLTQVVKPTVNNP